MIADSRGKYLDFSSNQADLPPVKLWEGFSQRPGMDYYIYAQFETLHLLKEFVDDVVITAINSFVTLLRTSRRPALGSIFSQ